VFESGCCGPRSNSFCSTCTTCGCRIVESESRNKFSSVNGVVLKDASCVCDGVWLYHEEGLCCHVEVAVHNWGGFCVFCVETKGSSVSPDHRSGIRFNMSLSIGRKSSEMDDVDDEGDNETGYEKSELRLSCRDFLKWRGVGAKSGSCTDRVCPQVIFEQCG